jgi:hypothetical protein
VAKAFCSFFIAAGHALFLSVRNRYTHDIKNSVKMHPKRGRTRFSRLTRRRGGIALLKMGRAGAVRPDRTAANLIRF